MKNMLHVEKIEEYHPDPTKEEVKAVFERLMDQAKQFKETRQGDEVFCFYVRWIGWDVELDQDQEMPYDMGSSDDEVKAPDESKLQIAQTVSKLKRVKPSDKSPLLTFTGERNYTFNRYGLTKAGEAVCVEMYCLRLACLDHTHVILHQDKDEGANIQEKDINLNQKFNELTINPSKGGFQSSP